MIAVAFRGRDDITECAASVNADLDFAQRLDGDRHLDDGEVMSCLPTEGVEAMVWAVRVVFRLE